VAIAGILALGFALFIPPFQFNDEHSHFVRAYQISRGEIVAHEGERIPAMMLALLRRYAEGNWKQLHTQAMLHDIRSRPPDPNALILPSDTPDQKYFMWGLRATRLYCPVVYLPASAGILLARALNMPPLAMAYAARAMNVVCFLTGLWFALSLAPGFRVGITALALMPMTLHQAAAISADQVTIALSIVVLAMVLHARDQPVNRRYLVAMLVVFVLLTSSKNSYWALPLLFLVPAQQFGRRANKAIYIVAVVVAALGAVSIWNSLCHDSLLLFRQVAEAKSIHPQANGLLLARHPLRAMMAVAHSRLLAHLVQLLHGFVGAFGWDKFGLPGWTQLCYVFLLLSIAVLEPICKAFTIPERLLLICVSLGALIGTYVVLFIVDGKYADGQYSFWSAGVQGRYLIPYALVGLLALKQDRMNVSSAVMAPVVLAGCTLYAVASIWCVAAYYG
jgi:uncharacterized membrane protein